MSETTHILKKYWGYEYFRTPQEEIIESVLEGNDTLALLPTGAGKSLCFQIPALIEEGYTLVISPLIALMEDQVNRLKKLGIRAISLGGNIQRNDLITLLDNLTLGKYKLVYISPERLLQDWVFQRLMQAKPNLVAIDEAHCVSQWGQDFRPSYLKLSKIRESQPNLPIIALTASANPTIEKDIIQILGLQQPEIFRKSYFRKEIIYGVYIRENVETTLHQILNKHKAPTIIYVRTRKKAIEVSQHLNYAGFTSDFYHGGLDTLEKKKKLNSWISEVTLIMVATNAFGMGIDKDNVKNVIHLQIPEDIESYYQESGRAGRNGSTSFATTLLHPSEIIRTKKLYEDSYLSKDFLLFLYKRLVNHLQIAYGEGFEKEYLLQLDVFCKKNNLSITKTLQALDFLEKHSILTQILNQRRKTTLFFLAEHDDIIQYLASRPVEENVFQSIIHRYSGCKTIDTTIDISKLATASEINKQEVIQILERWHSYGLARFLNGNSDLILQFLEIREDERTINRIIPYLEKYNKYKSEAHNSILYYITNDTECKNKIILEYFGEANFTTCGKCSTCLQKKQKENWQSHPEKLKSEILDHLKHPTTLELLKQNTNIDESFLISGLQMLLEEHKIKKTGNQFICT